MFGHDFSTIRCECVAGSNGQGNTLSNNIIIGEIIDLLCISFYVTLLV